MIYVIAILCYIMAFWIGWCGGRRAGLARTKES